jgi:hypothetical protein
MPAETPLTPDPTLARLARFSPAPPALDRDELLFQAGRASARPGRAWKSAVAVLVVAQVTTLALWLGSPSHPAPVPGPETVRTPTPSSAPASDHPLDASSYAALVRWDGDSLPPAGEAAPAASDPVLSVSDGHQGRLFD